METDHNNRGLVKVFAAWWKENNLLKIIVHGEEVKMVQMNRGTRSVDRIGQKRSHSTERPESSTIGGDAKNLYKLQD
ncbi:uncharacterized [Tachysurus ichikawai]